uniref:Uncharacterized protein n=1 Tax=viral metagenome TaxID=1070528 RepID=A0A6M3L3V3_9ZZZZ
MGISPYDELHKKGKQLEGKVIQSSTALSYVPGDNSLIEYCPTCEKDTEHDGRYCISCHCNREGRTWEEDMAPRSRRETIGVLPFRKANRPKKLDPMPGRFDPGTAKWRTLG